MSTNFYIAVLASGKGSNFRAIVDAVKSGSIRNTQIVLCVSNNSTAAALDVARNSGIPALHISRSQYVSDDLFVRALLDAFRNHRANLVVLAGYMKKLSPAIVRAFKNRIINIHPALLPAFGGPGMYGHFVHEAVIASGQKVSGATVHLVDEQYDHGRILLQQPVPVEPNDTAESLARRVLNIEHELYPRVIRMITDGEIDLDGVGAQS